MRTEDSNIKIMWHVINALYTDTTLYNPFYRTSPIACLSNLNVSLVVLCLKDYRAVSCRKKYLVLLAEVKRQQQAQREREEREEEERRRQELLQAEERNKRLLVEQENKSKKPQRTSFLFVSCSIRKLKFPCCGCVFRASFSASAPTQEEETSAQTAGHTRCNRPRTSFRACTSTTQ